MTQAVDQISVIICAYTEKRWNELLAAVESVRHQTHTPKEIIVVIDHNPTLLMRAQEHLPDVIVTENKKRKGLSGARNTGIAVAQGEIVAFMDDDAIADENWIANLVEYYSNPHVVGVGGKIDPHWIGDCPSWFPSEFNWVVGCTYHGMPMQATRVRNVIGANMSMRRSIVTAIGGFRESFGWNKDEEVENAGFKWLQHQTGDEETELCIRVTQQWPDSIWMYAASAVVRHCVSVQRTHWKYFLWRCYYEGLGKALLVGIHGPQTGLSSERTYTFKVLPRGIIDGIKDALFKQHLMGLVRAGAIVAGLMATMIGYLVGSISSRISDLQGIKVVHVASSAQHEDTLPINVQ